jgi:O2-independent ubiquinone biosynthesis accessory factor UbiT
MRGRSFYADKMSYPESASSSLSPPSAPLLLALATRPLPLLPLQVVLTFVLIHVCREHPTIFDRLGDHARKRFGIKPTDLPFAFVLEPIPLRPCLSVVRGLPTGLDARIFTPLAGLLGLVEGSLDGDAMLFSRDLVVEGDIEAALALRNAIDDAQIDLVAELAGMFGPLAAPLQRILGAARALSVPSSRSSKGV